MDVNGNRITEIITTAVGGQSVLHPSVMVLVRIQTIVREKMIEEARGTVREKGNGVTETVKESVVIGVKEMQADK